MTDKKRTPRENQVNIDLGLGGIFKGIGNLLDLVSEMAEKSETVTNRMGEIKFGEESDLRGVYGFTVRSGLGGTPHVESFGNIRKTQEGPVVDETREPMVDIFDEKTTILIVAELPGVADQEITLTVQGDVFALATTGKRKYARELLLPAPVVSDGMTRSYNNGVLEVRLCKAE